MPAYAADAFGAEHVGSIYGLMLTAWSVAGVLGPMLIARLRESTGDYGRALYAIAALMLVSTIIPFFMPRTLHAASRASTSRPMPARS
jgi:OFA family oxalate/formate antiporter-like MFS transporter